MIDPKTLLANLKKAKFDYETLLIGGGEFDADEVYDLFLELCKDKALLNYFQKKDPLHYTLNTDA